MAEVGNIVDGVVTLAFAAVLVLCAFLFRQWRLAQATLEKELADRHSILAKVLLHEMGFDDNASMADLQEALGEELVLVSNKIRQQAQQQTQATRLSIRRLRGWRPAHVRGDTVRGAGADLESV